MTELGTFYMQSMWSTTQLQFFMLLFVFGHSPIIFITFSWELPQGKKFVAAASLLDTNCVQ